MFRLALVSYLTASMLAGPALCCCTALDLFGSKAHPSRGDQPERPAPRCHGHHAGRSCHAHGSQPRHHHADAGHHRATKTSELPDTPAHPCSCRESRFDALTVKASAADVGSFLRLQVAFCDGSAIVVLSPSILANLLKATIASQGTTTFPHMSAPEILRALQTFRC